MRRHLSRLRPFRVLLPALGLVAVALACRGASAEPERGIADLLVEPGTRRVIQPALMHADFWWNLDRRVQLDSVVYALDNGARCCRVLGRDSLWAVDYSWVYPHSGLPSRWYDAEDLFRVGDSLALSETTKVVITFGTCRTAVKAHDFASARREAERLRPRTMPPGMSGRLKFKLDQARQALAGKPAVVHGDPYAR